VGSKKRYDPKCYRDEEKVCPGRRTPRLFLLAFGGVGTLYLGVMRALEKCSGGGSSEIAGRGFATICERCLYKLHQGGAAWWEGGMGGGGWGGGGGVPQGGWGLVLRVGVDIFGVTLTA